MIINYCATKAAIRSFILSSREQLKATGASVKIIELYTPLVQSESPFAHMYALCMSYER